jgi:hypothetical protein
LTRELLNIVATSKERLSDHASVFGIVGNHPTTRQKPISVRWSKELLKAIPGDVFIRKTERISDGGSQNAAENV